MMQLHTLRTGREANGQDETDQIGLVDHVEITLTRLFPSY
jgi:hypothetical protein